MAQHHFKQVSLPRDRLRRRVSRLIPFGFDPQRLILPQLGQLLKETVHPAFVTVQHYFPRFHLRSGGFDFYSTHVSIMLGIERIGQTQDCSQLRYIFLLRREEVA